MIYEIITEIGAKIEKGYDLWQGVETDPAFHSAACCRQPPAAALQHG
jgi:hypothetical protein